METSIWMILSTTSSIIDALTIVTEETTDTVYVWYMDWYGMDWYGMDWEGMDWLD
jgi:hypothetical protein